LTNVCRALLFWRFRVVILDFKVVNSLKNREDASIFNVSLHVSQNALYPELFVSEHLIYGRHLVNADVVEDTIYNQLCSIVV
jgi:hypothetical protein